jgi:hypothetical protein
MSKIPRKRICLHIAINEKGEHWVSEAGPQDALTALAKSRGGTAYRVVDIEVDLLFASPDDARGRLAKGLRLVK